MISLDGYEITSQLYEGEKTIIYRGKRIVDNVPIVIKFLKYEYPTPQDILYFRNDYEIAKSFDIDGIIKYYDIVKYKNSFAITMEDLVGESLKQILKNKTIELKSFLIIAIKLCEIIGEIHKQHIIHKDIKPSNIILNTKTGKLTLIDFNISSKLLKENQTIVNVEKLEGTLPYISPTFY